MSDATKLHSLVDTVMHSPVATIDRKATLRDAAIALRDADIGTLVIMDGPVIVAILSERDLVRALADGADPEHIAVEAVMTSEPRYLTTGEEVGAAAELMVSAGIRHLPVLEEGRVVGMVSIRDVVRAVRR